MNLVPMWLLNLIARPYFNVVFHRVVTDAYTRGRIDSKRMHELCGEWNRQLWPERHAEAKGRVWSPSRKRFVALEELTSAALRDLQ